MIATAQFDDQGTAETYAEELYSPAGCVPQIPNLDAIGDDEIAFYREHGYLSVAQAFTPDEIDAAREGLIRLIMGGDPTFQGISFEVKARDLLPTLSLEDRQDAVRKLVNFAAHDPRLAALAFHEKLLGVVNRILGDKPELFQEMALLKPPRLGREKPWHQDLSYFNYKSGTPVVGVWIAIDEATIDNGCMQLLPGQHHEPVIHFKRRDWQICDTEILGQRSVAAPLKPGGLLLFDGLLPHGTPHNTSGRRRRALQYHYVGAHAEKIAATERMAVFGSEGKDVTC